VNTTPQQQDEHDRFRATLAGIEKRERQRRERRIALWHVAGWFTLFTVILWIAWKEF
jgi:type VI protein secretion system component VasF